MRHQGDQKESNPGPYKLQSDVLARRLGGDERERKKLDYDLRPTDTRSSTRLSAATET